ERWAERIKAWHEGEEPADARKVLDAKPPSSHRRDLFCYFDNTDVKLRAPVDAQSLMRKLGLQPGVPPRYERPQREVPLRAARTAARSRSRGSSRISANVRSAPTRRSACASVCA